MPDLRRCVCGREYWFPGQRWQHKDCVVTAPVVTREETPVVTQSRQVKWQRENRERYNAKMRAYRTRRVS